MRHSDHPKTTVVIPFFQRQTGLLANCVQSVLSQKGADNFQIIVVDDGSPISAADELREICGQTSRVRVITQTNSGPGAARNRGLDNVDAGTECVAFLDSDDQWEETFLADAHIAFERGCDLFFGNTKRYAVDKTRFEWGDSPELNLIASGHTAIDRDRELYEFDGDFFDFAVFRSSIISTSTMVYRFRKFPNLRFNVQLFNGQDRLFKLKLSKLASNVVFTPKVSANEGRGVNIFDSSRWGSEKSLNLIFNYIKLAKLILKEIPMNKGQRDHVKVQLDQSRYSFAVTVIHLLRSNVKVDLAVIRKTIATDPLTAALLVPNLVRMLFRKVVTRV